MVMESRAETFFPLHCTLAFTEIIPLGKKSFLFFTTFIFLNPNSIFDIIKFVYN